MGFLRAENYAINVSGLKRRHFDRHNNTLDEKPDNLDLDYIMTHKKIRVNR